MVFTNAKSAPRKTGTSINHLGAEAHEADQRWPVMPVLWAPVESLL